MKRPLSPLALCGSVALFGLSSVSSSGQVDYATEIRPIFQSNCIKCHGPEKAKSKYRLDSRAAALKGGADGVAIIPGDSEESPLIHLVEDGEMPPKGPALSAGQIAKLKAWIDEGAKWGRVAPKPPVLPEGADVPGPELAASDDPGATVPGGSLPPPAALEVDFVQNVHPILKENCMKCHGAEKPKGRFRLDNRVSALKGGSEGVAIIPGKSAQSSLIHFAAHLVEDMEMPPVGKGKRLSAAEIGILRAWIDQGAKWDGTSDTPDFAISITPGMQWWSVDGNEAMFREHNWMREGWTGGVHATMEHWLDPSTRITGEAAINTEHDYDITLELERQELGFVRGGVEQFRRYYNDYGGHYAPFASSVASSFSLGRDLHLDTGRAWAELGLRLPDLPELTLGYEYRYREGMKSTLHWGPSTQGGAFETRNIIPAYKRIDEEVHILRGTVKHDFDGLEIENNFVAEFFNLDTRRKEVDPSSFGATPGSFTHIDESRESTRLTNTVSVQKLLKDWWLVSGGYYYSHLDSDAAFQQATINPMGMNVVGSHWFSRPIVLDWNSHVVNANTRLGPWNGLTISGGLQGNWQTQSAVGNSTLFFGLPDPNVPIPPFFVSTVSSNKQTVTARENVAIRYTKIPYTVLFAEGEWKQEDVDHFEQNLGVLAGFLRDTRVESRDQDYRVGFNVSPKPRVSLSSHYRYRQQDDRYDHTRDFSGGAADTGYSAFIRGRELESHELQARLNVRPQPWLRTLVTYKHQNTDYRTATDSVIFGVPSDTPGGELLAGEYDAHVYGLYVVLTPWQRVALNGTLSYHDSRTSTANNGDPAVDDYEGEIYSMLAGGSYRLNDRTDLQASYSYTSGDFSQGNAASGLPLGIEYQQHSVQVGVATQLSEHLRAQLQYQYQTYDEPSGGGVNDYTAHGIFLNCTLKWE